MLFFILYYLLKKNKYNDKAKRNCSTNKSGMNETVYEMFTRDTKVPTLSTTTKAVVLIGSILGSTYLGVKLATYYVSLRRV